MAIRNISIAESMCDLCGKIYFHKHPGFCNCEIKEVPIDMAILATENFEKIKTWFVCSVCKSVDTTIGTDVSVQDYLLRCNKCQHTGNVPFHIVDELVKKLGLI